MDAQCWPRRCSENIAVRHALTAIWNRNVLGLPAHAVLPYDERLELLPAYLQQLVMESLGKSVRLDGSPVEVDTVPVWWGGAGTDTQHSFFQALHQGTEIVPADFIGVIAPTIRMRKTTSRCSSNLFAQTEALANGQASDDPHRAYAGNRPSTLMLLDALTPESLGALIALYEHSVYLQSVLWGINAFDQFGVELGKQLANGLLPALRGEVEASDPVTRALLAEIRRRALTCVVPVELAVARAAWRASAQCDVLAHDRIHDGRPATPAQSSTSGVVGALPSATAMLRSQRSWPLRRIAEPSVRLQELGFGPREQLGQRGACPARCGRGNPARRCAWRTCSTGTPAGSRRSRRCGCR